MRTPALTSCETHDNVPPKAFRPTVLLARAGLMTPISTRLLRDPSRAGTRMYGVRYQDIERLPLEVARAWLEPLLGTKATARESQRWIASLHARDLLAVEPALRRLTVPTQIVWGTGDVFFSRRWAYWLRENIPGATEVVEVPGARLSRRASRRTGYRTPSSLARARLLTTVEATTDAPGRR